jgi:hypothetical protein
MEQTGNFLQIAASKLGADVGFGKMLLIYKEKKSLADAALSADAINAAIGSGDIIGIVQGWHTIAGAPVGELNVERTGTSEMKLIRAEIMADTITFENNIVNNEIIGDLVKAGSFECILLDDMGNAFGDMSDMANQISTMTINFSGKTTSSLQKDNVTEKTVAVTARYLVKQIAFLATETETELVEVKDLLFLGISEVTSISASSMVVVMAVKKRSNNAIFSGAITEPNVVVTGKGVTGKTVSFEPVTGLLTLTIAGAWSIGGDNLIDVSLNGATFYAKANRYAVRLGE